MKKLKYILILLLAPLALNAQCVFDTVRYSPAYPPYTDTTALGSPLLCYAPCNTCVTSFTCTVPPMNACLIIETSDTGWVSAVVMDSCNIVLKDTCFYNIPDAAVFGIICYSSASYTNFVICTEDQIRASVLLTTGLGSGWPLLTPIVDLDTLCSPLPPPVYIVHPIKVDTILVGSYDLQGRPWKSGPCIEVYQVGTEFYVRKFWDVYKK